MALVWPVDAHMQSVFHSAVLSSHVTVMEPGLSFFAVLEFVTHVHVTMYARYNQRHGISASKSDWPSWIAEQRPKLGCTLHAMYVCCP